MPSGVLLHNRCPRIVETLASAPNLLAEEWLSWLRGEDRLQCLALAETCGIDLRALWVHSLR